MHEAFKEIIAFWLKRGVGGFRFDAITTLFEDPSLADEGVVLDKNGKPVINAYGDPQLDGSKTDNQPGVHAVVAGDAGGGGQVRYHEFPGARVMIGETYLPNIGELKKMYGTPREAGVSPADGHAGGHDQQAGRDRVPAEADRRGNRVSAPIFRCCFSIITTIRGLMMRYGDGVHDTEIERVIATVLFASRGVALFYYGDEIGMKTTPPKRKEDVKDPIGITGWPNEKGRDGERTPMQWDAKRERGVHDRRLRGCRCRRARRRST